MIDRPQNPASSPRNPIWRMCYGIVTGSYIDRVACDLAFERMHRRDAIGDRIHLVLACLGIACLFGPVTMTEIALIPMIVFFFVRVINTASIWIHGFGQPAVLAMLIVVTWMFVALGWSADRTHGLAEIGQLRWFAAMGFLFPVIEQRTKLVYAMCVGLALGQVGQILDALNGFGIESIAKLVENHPGRIAGWWHPVVGGGMLVAAMGLHIPAALLGSGRMRLAGIAGLTLSAIGVLATGTRGAWLAAAILCMVGVLVMLRIKRVPMKHVLFAGAIGIILLSIAGFVIRDSIKIRIDETRVELREINDGDYSSYSGRRVRMAQEAINAIKSHPIQGVGTGSYEPWCAQQDQPFGAHAHNSTLHILSTLGIVGGVLWAVVLVVVLRSAWAWGMQDLSNPYAMGPMLGIVGLMLASLTDCVHINAQSVAMLGVLVGLCPTYAPSQDKPQDKRAQGE